MQEIIDIYDRNGNWTGTRTKLFCHSKKNKSNYYKLVGALVVNDKNEILVQKRSKNKKISPLKWDISAAGHIHTGETPEEAISRETYEELGIINDKSDFEFIGIWENLKYFNFSYVYVLKINSNEKILIDHNEVEEVKFLNISDFENLLFSDEFADDERKRKEWIFEKLKKMISERYFSEKEKKFSCSTDFIGHTVEVTMDRPLGTKHPKHNFEYELNYGYIAGTTSYDGEELDAYVLGEDKPLATFMGKVIAVIHRTSKTSFGDDKLVVTAFDKEFSDEEIKLLTDFQEHWEEYDTYILRK